MSDPLSPLNHADTESQFFKIMATHPEVFVAYYGDLEIDPYQRDVMLHARNEERSLTLLPAQHGKSTLLVKWFPIWEICCNPNVRILIVTKDQESAGSYAETFMEIFLGNEKLIADWGPFGPTKVWTKKRLNVAKRTIVDEHNTLEFFGAGAKVLGHRSDITIVDDVCTDETAKTAMQRKEQLRWFRQEAQTGPKPLWPLDPTRPEGMKVPKEHYWPKDIRYQRVVVCGTRFHPKDLYATLEEDSTYSFKYYDCFWDHDNNCPDPTETSALWPSGMPVEKLLAERESSGIIDFNKRFRNIAFDESEIIFHETYVRGGNLDNVDYGGILDRTRSFGEFEESWLRTTGFDPASGGTSKEVTHPSYVCLGYDEVTEEFPIIDLYHFPAGCTLDDMLDVLLDGNPNKGIPGWRALYNYHLGKIEANACQRVFLANDRMMNEINSGLRIEPHQTQGNKWDAVMGVSGMLSLVCNSKIRLPYKTPDDQRKAELFIKQMVMFPKGMHDFMMALWFAWLAAKESKVRYEGYYLNGKTGRFRQNPAYAR